MRFALPSLFFFALWVGLALADTNGMIRYSNQYCDKKTYQNGLGRADAYGGDCAHFVIRSIGAGACLPALNSLKNENLWAYNSFSQGGTHYNLICVGGPNHCWFNSHNVGGIYEFLRAHGWKNKLSHPKDWDAVQAACAVMGNPKGTTRGPWDHAAFGVGHRRVNAHTSDHCNVDVATIFESLQAVLCPPASCLPDTPKPTTPRPTTPRPTTPKPTTPKPTTPKPTTPKPTTPVPTTTRPATTLPPTTKATTVPPTTTVTTTLPPTTKATTVPPTTTVTTTLPATTKATTVPPTTQATTLPPTTKATTVPPTTVVVTPPPTTTVTQPPTTVVTTQPPTTTVTQPPTTTVTQPPTTTVTQPPTTTVTETVGLPTTPPSSSITCKACEELVNGACQLKDCGVCSKCDEATNQCAVTADATCGSGGECFEQKCQADGKCASIPKVNSPCQELAGDQCNNAVCDASGKCALVPLDSISCEGPAQQQDRNVTLCQRYQCVRGSCQAVPREAGLNCTHRRNETNLDEAICVYSYCDGNGMCLASNETSPLCVTHRKSAGKAAIIGGAVAGGAIVIAAVVVGAVVLAKGAGPVAAGFGADTAASSAVNNPVYTQLADGENPLYA